MKSKFWYNFLSFTWGLPMQIIGGLVALFLLITGHKPKRHCGCIYFQIFNKSWGGLELGRVFLTDHSNSEHIKNHEFGHSFQCAWWGPLYIFVIWIPSAIRYWYFDYMENHHYDKYKKMDYDSIWFEKQATDLGYDYFDLYK